MSYSPTLERLRRAELAKLRMDELLSESRTCRDPVRAEAIAAESEIVLQSLRDIRREQLLADVERYGQKPAEKARRSFWDGFLSAFGIRRAA